MLHASALRTTADFGSDLLPISAAGREDVFFFGTLMHPQVLEAVLARPVAAGELSQARLPGYRRVKVLDATYPVIVEYEDSAVDGIILHRPSLYDILRINHFEDEEYTAGQVFVEMDGGFHPAWAFHALDLSEATDEEWTLDSWSNDFMPSFLELVDGWMEDAPS